MSHPSRKLFVPDQAIYWLDASRIESKTNAKQQTEPTDKHHWLATHNLPEFVEGSKQSQQSPWRRIDGIEPRTEFLKHLGPAGDVSKRKLLCFTASAGVGKSIALQQIAYLRSLDPEHLVIRYHFSELPLQWEHFLLTGQSKGMIGDSTRLCLVDALMQTIHGPKYRSSGFPTLTTLQETACVELIKHKIQNGQVTLIVDGLDELTDKKEGVSKATAIQKLLFDSQFLNLHCVVAGRPYSIHQDYKRVFFDDDGNSAWDFCLAAIFTESQNRRYLGSRYNLLTELMGQTQLTPRHMEVLRGLPNERFSRLHSLACVYFEVMQESLRGDISREGSIGLLQQLDVDLTEDQYIGFLAALASVTADSSKDQLTVDLNLVERELHRRVKSLTKWEGISFTEFGQKLAVIRSLNHRSIEFSYFRRNDDFIIWKDRTVMDFFTALWMVRYSTDEQRKTICDQVPRSGEIRLDENRRDLWTFIAGMPSEALEHFDEDLSYDARWNELVQRLFQPFSDAKRPTQLMYIAWQELQRGVMDKTREGSVTQVMNSYTQQYVDLRNRGDEASKIIDEDLEGQYKQIPEPAHGWSRVAVGHKDYPDNPPHTVAFKGPYEVSAYPVTRRLYRLFDPRHEIAFQDDFNRHSPDPRCPAIKITWYDAMMFAAWVSARLMDEYEWEYSCRSDIGDRDLKKTPLEKYFWKDDPDGSTLIDHAWVSQNSQRRTWPVDAKQDGSHTNGFGLVDMLGNVWEWTASVCKVGAVSRVLRGGSFDYNGRNASASFRSRSVPAYTSIIIGFRVARAPEGKS